MKKYKTVADVIKDAGAKYYTFFNDFYVLETDKVNAILRDGNEDILERADFFTGVNTASISLQKRSVAKAISTRGRGFVILHTCSKIYELNNFVTEHEIPDDCFKITDRLGANENSYFDHRFALSIQKKYLFERFGTKSISKCTVYKLPRSRVQVRHMVGDKIKTSISQKKIIFLDATNAIKIAKCRDIKREPLKNAHFAFENSVGETMLIINK